MRRRKAVFVGFTMQHFIELHIVIGDIPMTILLSTLTYVSIGENLAYYIINYHVG